MENYEKLGVTMLFLLNEAHTEALKMVWRGVKESHQFIENRLNSIPPKNQIIFCKKSAELFQSYIKLEMFFQEKFEEVDEEKYVKSALTVYLKMMWRELGSLLMKYLKSIKWFLGRIIIDDVMNWESRISQYYDICCNPNLIRVK